MSQLRYGSGRNTRGRSRSDIQPAGVPVIVLRGETVSRRSRHIQGDPKRWWLKIRLSRWRDVTHTTEERLDKSESSASQAVKTDREHMEMGSPLRKALARIRHRVLGSSRRPLDRNKDRLRATDMFIASYPRSGNTWIRHLVADVVLQMHDLPFQPGEPWPIHPDQIIPDMHAHNIDQIDPRIDLPSRLVKTHELFDGAVDKVVYVFRLPADTLVSYYHYHRRYEHLRDKASLGVDLFCLEHLGEWCAHVTNFARAKAAGNARFLFVSYETMHQRTVAALQDVALFLGLDVDESTCKVAVDNHSFEKKYASERLGEQHHGRFYRKGKVGSAREELCGTTMAAIVALAGPVYSRAKELEAS